MAMIIPFIARLFLAAIFLIDAIFKVLGFSSTTEFMANAGLPIPQVLLTIAIILLVLGSFSLILGYKARWGAALLLIFMVVATSLFHLNLVDQMQQIQFLKNLAIIGGLLLILYWGPGPVSIDRNKSVEEFHREK